MTMLSDADVRSIRIDSPSPTSDSASWFFLEREDVKWDRWFGELFAFLLSFGPRTSWGTSPDTGSELETFMFEGENREKLLAFLRTAPEPFRTTEHRALRRALERIPKTNKPVRVVYFGPEDPRRDDAPTGWGTIKK